MKSFTGYSTLFVNKITHGKLVTVIHCQVNQNKSGFISLQWWIFTKTSQKPYYWQIRYKKADLESKEHSDCTICWNLAVKEMYLCCLALSHSNVQMWVHLNTWLEVSPFLRKKRKKSLTKRAQKTTKPRDKNKMNKKQNKKKIKKLKVACRNFAKFKPLFLRRGTLAKYKTGT